MRIDLYSLVEQSGCLYQSTLNPSTFLAPTRSDPQDTVTLAILLQVIVCMFPVDTTLVTQMKVLISGQGQYTVVADPNTIALLGGVAGLLPEGFPAWGEQLFRHPPI